MDSIKKITFFLYYEKLAFDTEQDDIQFVTESF